MNENLLEDKLNQLDEWHSQCTGCGLCNEACATFQASGWEHESPRGRLQLAAQFLHGHIHPQSTALETFDRCLGCQSCEPLCPQQIPYRQVRQLVQEIRAELNPLPEHISMRQAEYRRWVILAQRIGNFWWRRYGWKWLKSKKSFLAEYKEMQHEDHPVLAICCAQDLFQPELITATLAWMKRLGYSMRIDKNQPCCGAIFERLIHGGKETILYPKIKQKAISKQKKRLKTFLNWMTPQTYFLARGCQYYVEKQRAHVSDFYGWIETILVEQKLTLYFPQNHEVYYQPYCGQIGRESEDPIWRLLNKIKGLKLKEICHPMTCCGGYAGESFLHPEHAQFIARQKLAALPVGATLIVTSPDCWAMFNGKGLNVLYPVQLLTQAYIQNLG